MEHAETPQSGLRLAPADCLSALLAEYNLLASWMPPRVTAIERRIPLAGLIAAGFLGFAGELTWDAQILVMIGIPVTLVVLVSTAKVHAQTIEDFLRRMGEIEQHVNTLANTELMCFQSTHPSNFAGKTARVGGRFCHSSITAIIVLSLLVLVGCGVQWWTLIMQDVREVYTAVYIVGLLFTICVLVYLYKSLQQYEYKKTNTGTKYGSAGVLHVKESHMISETKGDGNLVDFDSRKRVGPIIVHLVTFERDDMLFRFGRIAATTDSEVLQFLKRSLDGNGRFIFETEDGELWTALLMGSPGVEYYDFSAVTRHVKLDLH